MHGERVPTTGVWTRLIEIPQPCMTDDPVRPQKVAADECLHLQRQRTQDLSISLSQAGRPLENCRVEGLGTGKLTLTNTMPVRGQVHEGIFDPCLLIDFGRVITAYPELEIEGPAGTIIELGYAERLVNGHFNNAIECFFGDAITLNLDSAVKRKRIF
ncbi:MAG: family 78 glycoside hydrolase catalytic domain [Opitutales bacterium]